MRKLLAENLIWIDLSKGRYDIAPVSETVKLCVSSVTVSGSKVSFTYSIFPLALLSRSGTTFSSMSGRTVCAPSGNAHSKRKIVWRAYLQVRRAEIESTVGLFMSLKNSHGIACA